MLYIFKLIIKIVNFFLFEFYFKFKFKLISIFLKKSGKNNKFIGKIYITGPTNITIGSNNIFNRFTQIDGSGELIIGDNNLFANNVTILSSLHNYSKGSNFADQGVRKKTTILENNIWLGANVVVSGGVKIGSNTVVSANSIVNKNIPPNSIYSSNSKARIISRN